MKRISVNILLVLLGCLLLVSALTGCAQQKIEFQEGQHIENATYAETFNTSVYIGPQFELHVEDQIFDEETAKSLIEIVQMDIESISDTFGSGKSPAIFVVEETPDEGIVAGSGTIYCSMDDITGGTYHYELVKAYLDINDPWKVTGAAEVLFGEEVDLETLATYYSNEENLTPLSLFAAYFLYDYSYTVPQTIITDTAAALTDFLLSEYGVEAFLSCTSQDEYRQAWLESLGASVDYQPTYNLRFLDEAVYSSSESYPLIITTENRVYAFMDGFAESAEDVMYLLAFYQDGMGIVMDYISENAPEHATQIESAWEELGAIYFQSDIYGSYVNQSGKELHVGNASLRGLFHTTFNYLIPQVDREMEIWKTLGIADYLLTMAKQPDVAFYNYFLSEFDESWEDDAVYLALVQEYYLSHDDYPATLNDFDFALFYEGMAVITMNYPELELTSNNFAKYSIARWSGSEAKYKPYTGNTLTFAEAYLLSKYLVETYGLDNMLSYCMTYATLAFQNSFGVTYNEAYRDFKAIYTISD